MRLWRTNRFTLITSSEILQEYLEVLGRFVSAELLKEWGGALTDPSRVHVVEATERIDAIPEDPADNRFLECAVAARADVIVSGDHHLLKLTTFRDIPILTPTAFLQRLAA